MAAGEQYSVPADAKGPQILTGRPDALTVTIDGAVVAPLGTGDRTIKDVGISAAALLARTDPGGSAADGGETHRLIEMFRDRRTISRPSANWGISP